MASGQMSRGFTPRGSGRMDSQQENFEKTQLTALQKAINATETPLKEKHVRRAILGSHQEQGCSMFWSVVLRFQLQGNPIVCWKFCHILHKILRDGHGNCAKDSIRYTGFLTDLGKLWGHLKLGLGRLIAFYTKLLVGRLEFHKKYPLIPGNLVLGDGDLDTICNNDINSYFEMCVDMLDYMDDILGLQGAVYGSLDMSRANSMTSIGQCRLAPLIPCILDSCQVYDSMVKLLFKLHSSLPPDTLSGHRDRFNKQYKDLKRFYYNSGNLQYFKNLIKVPSLPSEPPNFLVAADLASHVKPEAVISEPEPEPEEAPVDVLVDTISPQQNGAFSPPMPDERDIMIQQLMVEVTRLKEEISRIQAENQMMIESLQNRIHELELELNELKQIAESTQQENEMLRTALKDGEENQAAASRLLAMEKIAKTNDDKFKKIKDMYTRIRQEHVLLIRNHADASKQLTTEMKAKEEFEKDKQGLEQQLAELQHEKSTVEATLEQNSVENLTEILAANNIKDLLAKEKEELEVRLDEVRAVKEETQTKYDDMEDKQQKSLEQIKTLDSELDILRKDKGDTDSSYKQELEQHTKAKEKIQGLEAGLESLTTDRNKLKNDHAELEVKHTTALSDNKTLETKLEEMTNAKHHTEEQYEEEQRRHKEARDQIQSLLMDLADMTSSRDKAVAESNECKQKHKEAIDKIQNLENILSGVRGEKADTDSAYKQEQDEKQQALTKIQNVSAQLTEMTVQRDESRTQYKDLDTRHNEALTQIQSLEAKLSDVTLQRNEWQTDYTGEAKQHAQALETIQGLELDLSQAQEKHSSLQSDHTDLQSNYTTAKHDIEGLKSELDTAKASEAELNTKLNSTTDELTKYQVKGQDLSAQLSKLEAARIALEDSLMKSKSDLDQSQVELDQSKSDMDLLEQTLRKEIVDYRKHTLVSAVEEAESIIRDALSQSENPHISTITCTAEYLMDRATPVLQNIKQLRDSIATYCNDPQAIGSVIKDLCEFSHSMGDAIVFGYATSHAAPIEEGEALSSECNSCGNGSLQLLGAIRQEQYNKVPSASDHVDELVKRILAHAEALLPKVEDVKAEQMGDLVDQEMHQTTAAIAKAAEKIARMLAQSREKYTGIQLEVNEGILDSCNALMRAIMKLVEKSKNLQKEIVSQGRGTASAKDFYKKHNRWTEGLISAAKAVGWGANVLVEAADKAVRGEGKFEELMVCSQEIAASTTQLVVASKVKAQRGSTNLTSLAEASRGVTECTGRVVASAKNGADAIEELDAMDFSKLTLHQSKRLEMESQVKVIELESNLEKERRKLSELRKTHYRLAGESEGWEQEDSNT